MRPNKQRYNKQHVVWYVKECDNDQKCNTTMRTTNSSTTTSTNVMRCHAMCDWMWITDNTKRLDETWWDYDVMSTDLCESNATECDTAMRWDQPTKQQVEMRSNDELYVTNNEKTEQCVIQEDVNLNTTSNVNNKVCENNEIVRMHCYKSESCCWELSTCLPRLNFMCVKDGVAMWQHNHWLCFKFECWATMDASIIDFLLWINCCSIHW